MSVFKHVTSKDIIRRKQVDEVKEVFNDSPSLKKTGSGWNATKNSAFTDEPSISASVYFVESSSFYVSYAKETPDTDYEQYLMWNSLMSTISAPWDRENERYDFYLNDNRITEAVIISFNPENYGDTLDPDNFFVVVSGSTSDTGFSDKSGDTYDVTENLVLAPYHIKSSIDDTNTNGEGTSKLSPAYEMRTSDANAFLSYDETLDSISIDWEQGTASVPMGVAYPEVGLIILFPELFGRTQITNAIRSAGDRSKHSLNSIMVIGAYGKHRKEKTIVFSRLYNDEFNFSTNPTTFVEAGGELRIREELEEDNAKTYITQVGFYNRQNECVATGFLSHPIEKSFITENNLKIEIQI